MSTFGNLLAGHIDEHHEVFQHLQACCLSAGESAQVASLLEAIGGSQRHLRTAHSAWGLPRCGGVAVFLRWWCGVVNIRPENSHFSVFCTFVVVWWFGGV